MPWAPRSAPRPNDDAANGLNATVTDSSTGSQASDGFRSANTSSSTSTLNLRERQNEALCLQLAVAHSTQQDLKDRL